MALPPLVKRFLIPWRTYVAVLVPIILSPLALREEASHRCGYVVIIMIIFWITEALPLGVTSLLPAVFFPLLGIMTTTETCMHYLKDTNMLFIGGLIAAIAVEYSNLHYRIALKVILIVGTTPMRILVGLMITTMFLSMWIVNSAATALMAPIVGAMVAELKATRAQTNKDTEGGKAKDGKGEGEFERPDQETIGYYIAIAYSSSIGGIGTIIGTGTNLSLKGIQEANFPDANDLNFLTWMYFGIPYMLVANAAMTVYLLLFYMSLCRKKTPEQISNFENAAVVRGLIREKYTALGSMTFHEIMVLFWFALLILIWVFRSPQVIPGWAEFFYETKIKDASPVMLIIIILFMLPANLNFLDRNQPFEKPTSSVLVWPLVQSKVSWGLMLLLGGSFAMARGMSVSLLSSKLGKLLANLRVLPTGVIMMITAVTTTIITQFSSNVAAANIALPVLAQMAKEIQVHPLLLMLPATIGASLAFMLPVSTPPNAIVLEAGHLKTTDLIIAGAAAVVISLAVLFPMFLTFGVLVYDLNTLPDYAKN